GVRSLKPDSCARRYLEVVRPDWISANAVEPQQRISKIQANNHRPSGKCFQRAADIEREVGLPGQTGVWWREDQQNAKRVGGQEAPREVCETWTDAPEHSEMVAGNTGAHPGEQLC